MQLAELAIETMHPVLVDPGMAAPLIAAAGQLSATACLGFECRLGAAGGPIDVSQRFRIRDDGVRHLRTLAATRADQSPDAAESWLRLSAFADFWECDPDLIVEFWLEADAEFEGDRPLPSIFVMFGDDAVDDPRAFAALSVLADGLEQPWQAATAALERARSLGIEPGRLFGLMLSRSGALRATFRRPGVQAARALLTALEWNGALEQIDAILTPEIVATRNHQLVLDFAPALLPGGGIEILFDSKIDGRGELAAVLDWISETGWGVPERAAGLLEWSGTLAPSRARGRWPDALVVRGMLRDPGDSVLMRFVNHLKFNLAPGVDPVAKAYFGLCTSDVWT